VIADHAGSASVALHLDEYWERGQGGCHPARRDQYFLRQQASLPGMYRDQYRPGGGCAAAMAKAR